MFEDIKAGIIADDFSPTAIKEFFESTASIMFRDCKECVSDINDINKEIQKAANAASKGAKAVRNIAVSNENYEKFKQTSLNETENILRDWLKKVHKKFFLRLQSKNSVLSKSESSQIILEL